MNRFLTGRWARCKGLFSLAQLYPFFFCSSRSSSEQSTMICQDRLGTKRKRKAQKGKRGGFLHTGQSGGRGGSERAKRWAVKHCPLFLAQIHALPRQARDKHKKAAICQDRLRTSVWKTQPDSKRRVFGVFPSLSRACLGKMFKCKWLKRPFFRTVSDVRARHMGHYTLVDLSMQVRKKTVPFWSTTF